MGINHCPNCGKGMVAPEVVCPHCGSAIHFVVDGGWYFIKVLIGTAIVMGGGIIVVSLLRLLLWGE